MKLSIIIVTYNSGGFICPCLRSLNAACAGFESEIIIVDNGSSDRTLEFVRTEWPGATILRNPANRGFAVANNQGARVSRGDFLLLLNADTVLLDENLQSALEYAERQGVAILGPRMVGTDGALQRTWNMRNSVGSYLSDILSLATSSRRLRREPPSAPLAPVPVRFLLGAALLISRAAYERYGLFDERFFFCCEERDLCLRCASAGERLIYFPQWSVLHYGGGGNSASRFHLDNWISASFLFTDKHGAMWHRILVRLVFPLFLLTNCAAFLLKAMARRKRQYWRLAMLYGGALWRIPKLCGWRMPVRRSLAR